MVKRWPLWSAKNSCLPNLYLCMVVQGFVISASSSNHSFRLLWKIKRRCCCFLRIHTFNVSCFKCLSKVSLLWHLGTRTLNWVLYVSHLKHWWGLVMPSPDFWRFNLPFSWGIFPISFFISFPLIFPIHVLGENCIHHQSKIKGRCLHFIRGCWLFFKCFYFCPIG